MRLAAPRLYGIIAEFDSADDLVFAAKKTVSNGYKKIDTYTPFPVHELNEILDLKDPRIQWIIFIFGVLGGVAGFALCAYVTVYDYPINTGGRPLFSWPSYIPITFECTVLCAGFAALISMLLCNGLPKLYHPVFNVPGFENASRNKFYLLIKSDDPKFGPEESRQFLEELKPLSVSEVIDGNDE